MKKITLIYSILILLILKSSSVFSQQILSTGLSNGEISYYQYLEYSALNVFEPEQVPEKYRKQESDPPQKSGTFIMMEVKRNWDKLSAASREILAKHLQRPQLDFNTLSPSGKFRIHYTTSGYHAIDATDNDHNSVPDYADSAGIYFDYIHYLLMDSLGYKAPPADSGGLGKEFDVYLLNLSIYYGITWLEPVPGENNVYSCYMEVENDFLGFPTPPYGALKVTSAHEYFHAVQVGYFYRDDDVFFMEMSSTWMEDFAHEDVNDYLNYLSSFFNRINYPFSYTDGNLEYGASLWNHMIAKKYRADIILKIWEQIPNQNAMNSISNALVNYGTSFSAELANFGLWNYFTGERSDPEAFYPDGELFPEANFKGRYTLSSNDLNFESSMSKLSSSYYLLDDPVNEITIGLIVTNFETPQKNHYGNLDPLDKADFNIDVVTINSSDSAGINTFLAKNQLVRVSDQYGIRLNVDNKENWWARAVIFSQDGNYEIIQFFPSLFIEDNENKNFIENIYPNPLIVGGANPLLISYYAEDKDIGEINIYSADGRLIKHYPIDTHARFSDQIPWDGRDDSGALVASGVYIAVMRVGKDINSKKLAVIRK